MDSLRKKLKGILDSTTLDERAVNFVRNSANQAVVNTGKSFVGRGLVNTQSFFEGNKPVQIPQLTRRAGNLPIGTIPIVNKQVNLGQAWDLGRSFVNPAINLGYGAATDLGTNIGKTISGQPLKQYDQLKSPFTKAGYQISNVIQPQNTAGYRPNMKPQEILGNVGGIGEGLLSIYGGGKALNAITGKATAQSVKAVLAQGVARGGLLGGAYGASTGLSTNKDQSLGEQISQAGIQGGFGLVGGAALGGVISLPSAAKTSLANFLVKRHGISQPEAKKVVDFYLRDKTTGRFKSQGGKKGQEELIRQVEGLGDKGAIYLSDIDKYIKLKASKMKFKINEKGPGLSVKNVRDQAKIQQEIDNLSTDLSSPATNTGLGQPLLTGKGTNIAQGGRNTNKRSASPMSIADDANAGLYDTGIPKGMENVPQQNRFYSKSIIENNEAPQILERNGIKTSGNLPKTVTVYRNIDKGHQSTLRPYDFVTLDKSVANGFRGKNSEIIKMEVPIEQVGKWTTPDTFVYLPKSHVATQGLGIQGSNLPSSRLGTATVKSGSEMASQNKSIIPQRVAPPKAAGLYDTPSELRDLARNTVWGKYSKESFLQQFDEGLKNQNLTKRETVQNIVSVMKKNGLTPESFYDKYAGRIAKIDELERKMSRATGDSKKYNALRDEWQKVKYEGLSRNPEEMAIAQKALDESLGVTPRVAQQPLQDARRIPLKPKQLQSEPLVLNQQTVNSVSSEANPLISNAQDTIQLQGQPQSRILQSQQQPNIPVRAQSQVNSLDDIISQGKEEISSGGSKIDKRTIKDFAEDVYTSWVDRFYPITKVAGSVEKSLKIKGAALRPEYNPIYTIKKFLGAGGIAENRIENDFKPILKLADDLGVSKDDLDVYLINRRKVGFGDIDREIYGSDPVKAKAIKDALEAKYGQQIENISTPFYSYREKLFDELVDAGFIAKDKAPIIKKQNPDYAPFYREMETELDNYLGVPSSKLQQAKNPLSTIEGSKKKILSPVESTIADTIRYRAAIEKNNVAKSIVGLQKAMPELNFKKVSQSSPDTITVWENGQKNFYEVGRDIADTVKGLNEEQMNSILKVLTIPSSILRQGATGRNPAFMIPNMVRDQLDAAINSKYGYVPFLDYARGLSHLLKKDDVYQRWQQSGSQIALSELSGRKSINAMFNEKQGKKKFFDWITKGLDVAGKYSEQPTRLGLFSKGLKKTGNDLFANMESREGTLDFARMGSKMKTANSLIPFLNVGVQGFDKMIRTAKANPARFTALMGIYGAAPTIATTLWNVQNFPEEYKEVPQWEKNTNFIIVTGRNEKGTVDYIAIPKGNVIQYISNPIENFISYASDTNSQTVQQMATQFISGGLPVLGDGTTVKEVAIKTVGQNLPQAIKPTTENLLNKSFFKYNNKTDEAREIVPYYLKDKAPGDQSYEFTPSAYKTIGKAIDVSPLLVQNFLEGSLAGYVKEPLSVYESFKSIADGEPVDKNKAFILRRFLKETYPTSSNSSSGGKAIVKRELAKESGILNSADASGFSLFGKKKKEQTLGDIIEVEYFDKDNKKQTFDLTPDTKGSGIGAIANTDWKEKQAAKLHNIEGIPQEEKNKIYKEWGIEPEDARYAALAGYNSDVSAQYIAEKSQSHDELIDNILTGRVVGITGTQFADNGTIDKLWEQGLLSDAERKELKAIKIDKNGKSLNKPKAGKKGKKFQVKVNAAKRVSLEAPLKFKNLPAPKKKSSGKSIKLKRPKVDLVKLVKSA